MLPFFKSQSEIDLGRYASSPDSNLISTQVMRSRNSGSIVCKAVVYEESKVEGGKNPTTRRCMCFSD